ncbi:MAG: ATP-dependent Clp protease adaptor ClpS [Chloroflexota bacterium]
MVIVSTRMFASDRPLVRPRGGRRTRLAVAGAPSRAPVTPQRSPVTDDDASTRRRLLPPYKVILHNDDHNSMDHVVQALRKSIPGMSLGRAAAVMWEAHVNGKALVLACPLELAELYQQRLLSFGLSATIERDD